MKRRPPKRLKQPSDIRPIAPGRARTRTLSSLTRMVLRDQFARPIDAVRDAGALVAAFAVACCIPVAIVERSNITIRFLSTIAGPRTGRIADVAAAILVEIILILMTWQFFVFANQARLTGTATWMLRIPAAPVWAAVALILGISAVLQIVVGIKTFHGDYLDGHPKSAD